MATITDPRDEVMLAILEHRYLEEADDELWGCVEHMLEDARHAFKASGADYTIDGDEKDFAAAAPDTCWMVHCLARRLRGHAENLVEAAEKLDAAASSLWMNARESGRDDTLRNEPTAA